MSKECPELVVLWPVSRNTKGRTPEGHVSSDGIRRADDQRRSVDDVAKLNGGG